MIHHHVVIFFVHEFHLAVARLGLESIELWSIGMKYLNFMMKHTYYVCASYLIVRLAQLSLFSVTTVKLYAGGHYKFLN